MIISCTACVLPLHNQRRNKSDVITWITSGEHIWLRHAHLINKPRRDGYVITWWLTIRLNTDPKGRIIYNPYPEITIPPRGTGKNYKNIPPPSYPAFCICLFMYCWGRPKSSPGSSCPSRLEKRSRGLYNAYDHGNMLYIDQTRYILILDMSQPA